MSTREFCWDLTWRGLFQIQSMKIFPRCAERNVWQLVKGFNEKKLEGERKVQPGDMESDMFWTNLKEKPIMICLFFMFPSCDRKFIVKDLAASPNLGTVDLPFWVEEFEMIGDSTYQRKNGDNEEPICVHKHLAFVFSNDFTASWPVQPQHSPMTWARGPHPYRARAVTKRCERLCAWNPNDPCFDRSLGLSFWRVEAPK